MKKSRTVSYSSEEVKRLPDESDWAGSAAMTEDEIRAAIASDPEEAALGDDWMKRGTVVRRKARFVMCINNQGNGASLTLRRVYKVIPDEKGEKRQMIRIVDDTGEDYLFSASCLNSRPGSITGHMPNSLKK